MKLFIPFIYIALFLISFNINAQYHEDVFPGQTGTTLLSNLVNNFKTQTVLTYGPARDTLYKRVYRIDGQVHCVYTDWGIDLPDNVDPSTYIYQNGLGINAEHNYPKSKGATQGTQAYSDMHNLFPSRADVNTDRGHLPFNEVNDNSTLKWYNQNQELNGIPSSNIDLYSELGANSFEPREAHKGNVARAIFYFYTMYKEQADNADNTFFPTMQEDLCQWHIQDPVDSLEWVRTQKIATYQDNKRNPFVLDCSLAVRTYCGQWLDENSCPIIDDIDETTLTANEVRLRPNPVSSTLYLELPKETLALKSINDISIIDVLGHNIHTVSSISTNIQIDVNGLNEGMYFVRIMTSKGVITKSFIKMH